jgi:DNA end-binding protein Ku
VVPEKGVGAEAFAVIREAMKKAGKIAIGCLVLRGRERQLALEVHGKGLVAYSLRPHDEVRDADDFFDDIPAVKADKDMVDIAARIISQKDAAFDPTQFKDRYDEALREMIKAKQKGQGVVEAPEPDDTNVIDLMEALRASLKGSADGAKKAPAKKTATKASTTAKKATTKKPASKKKAA